MAFFPDQKLKNHLRPSPKRRWKSRRNLPLWAKMQDLKRRCPFMEAKSWASWWWI